jgi:hypothetical protein
MRNLAHICGGLFLSFTGAAHADLLNVVCTGTRGAETKTFEYLVDTDAPLNGFIGEDIAAWTVSGQKLVGITRRNEQFSIDNETSSVRFNGELVDQERMHCTWDFAGTNSIAPNDDTMLAITARIVELERRISFLEAK